MCSLGLVFFLVLLFSVGGYAADFFDVERSEYGTLFISVHNIPGLFAKLTFFAVTGKMYGVAAFSGAGDFKQFSHLFVGKLTFFFEECGDFAGEVLTPIGPLGFVLLSLAFGFCQKRLGLRPVLTFVAGDDGPPVVVSNRVGNRCYEHKVAAVARADGGEVDRYVQRAGHLQFLPVFQHDAVVKHIWLHNVAALKEGVAAALFTAFFDHDDFVFEHDFHAQQYQSFVAQVLQQVAVLARAVAGRASGHDLGKFFPGKFFHRVVPLLAGAQVPGLRAVVFARLGAKADNAVFSAELLHFLLEIFKPRYQGFGTHNTPLWDRFVLLERTERILAYLYVFVKLQVYFTSYAKTDNFKFIQKGGNVSISELEFSQGYKVGFQKTTRFLSSLGLKGDMVNEIAQNAWVKAWEHREQLQEPKFLSSWVNTIALNCFRVMCRQKKEFVGIDEISEQLIEGLCPSLCSSGSWRELHNKFEVRSMLDRMDERDRNIFVLHYYDGLSTHEIGDMIGLDPVSVRVRMLRAKQLLRKQV